MVSCFISRLVILLFGTLYPAYASYKAVRTKNVKEYVKWMMYWIVFALFTCAETFTDLFLSFWFPFYYEIKIITVIYLLSPATKGSSILYRKFVHPVLIKREQEIDEYISKAKEQGYHTMLNLGSKGVTYATSLIMQTAIKGGGGIVSQLRKSYSLGDLSEEKNLRNRERESEDDVDSIYEEEPRLIRRIPRQSPRRTASIASDADLYFPEVDSFHRPLMYSAGHYYNSQNPSLEEISSGYSSGNTVYSAEQKPRADHLVRTASLGSSRIRTRSTTKTGLPKRSSLSEGGSTMSAMESQEGQIESDEISITSLSQSAPFFPPFFPLNNLMRPEHQYVFGRMPQNQMFAFFNPSQYCSPENNFESNFKTELGKNPSITISEIKSENGEEIINLKEKDVKQEKKLKEKENDVTENKEKEEGDNTKDKVAENPKIEDSASFSERSGRYNKKSAPAPPIEGLTSTQETSRLEYEDDLEFSTPSSSPKLDKKLTDFSSCNSVMSKNESKSEDKTKIKKSGAMLQKPKNSKSKGKKDGKISKKLQFPKITFPFWQQKSSKISSGSETSSVASIEAPIAKPHDTTDLEYFISLKQTDDKEIEKVSNRKSF